MPLVILKIAIALFAAAGVVACGLLPSTYEGKSAPGEAAIEPLKSERPLIGLALGGGGARGFAHIGVIKALEAAGIQPDIVTGSSSGAVIAALYAAGHNGQELENIAVGLNRDDLLDFALFGRGWVLGEALQDFVNRMVSNRPIESLRRPFAAIATAAKSGRMTVFNRGNTGVAVRASASVPNLFVPPVINGEEFVDGGLTSPVPVRVARAMGADVVVAVDVSWFAQARGELGAEMAQHGRRGRYVLLNDELAAADIVITPRTVPTRMLDFEQKAANIAAGAEAARAVLPELEKIISRIEEGKRGPAQAAITP
jgi:NTE family protein